MYVAFLFMDAVFNLTGDLTKPSHSQTSGSIVAFWGFGIGVIVSGLAGLPLGQSVMENSVKQSQHWFRLFLKMFAAGVIIQIGSCGYSILD